MRITKPAFYDQFRCIASACPDSCCQEWAVVVDEDKAAFYRSLPGDLGDRLRAVLQEEDGETVMAIENRRCPMWRRDGLCRIQAELGEEALCQTCRDFPRLTHDYGNFTELQLELSCPVAAKLILTADDTPIEVLLPDERTADYDEDAMGVLLRTRETALSILADPALTPNQALAVLLLYGYAAQNELDGGEPAVSDPLTDLAQIRELIDGGDWNALLDFYRDLEILTERWEQRLSAPEPGNWSNSYCALARYFVRRYWLQAVSDYDLVSRVKLAVCSCLVIRTLGGDLTETTQLYSKEIENDADNIDAILDGAYTSPALADRNLLSLLLSDNP